MKRDLTQKLVPTFERSFEDAEVRVRYHRNNGLDGKVSPFQASSQPAGPLALLCEGNDGRQNLECTIGLSGERSIDFQQQRQCDNDEARSMFLYDVPAGRAVRECGCPLWVVISNDPGPGIVFLRAVVDWYTHSRPVT